MNKNKIIILGAGPVGSLMSCYLCQDGHEVVVYEKRPDSRKNLLDAGRSINLALSNRGFLALQEIGFDQDIRNLGIPMYGRMMHDEVGELTFQPYGKEGQAIYSVSRAKLNMELMTRAEALGATIYFDAECVGLDLEKGIVRIDREGSISSQQADFILGADGANSVLRKEIDEASPDFAEDITWLEHGYKELTIPPVNGEFAMEPEALHIWPRGGFMLIALPNQDKSFTCTLFFPMEGPSSFESLKDAEEVVTFFEQTFPDTLPLMPDLRTEYFENPTSKLATVQCFPWSHGENNLMIGDASHAIVPFYGQGMNSGFEDCRLLHDLILEETDLSVAFSKFGGLRKNDADAIRDLALQNFIEMRDLVGDESFLLRKRIEARLHEEYPDQWIPLYSMVTFSHLPYAEALERGRRQRKLMDEVMAQPGIEENWESMDFSPWVSQLN